MRLSLSGTWKIAFEDENSNREYKETIILPATTEQAGLGECKEEKTSLYLGRKWPVCGKVWYKRSFEVPKEWDGKYIQLKLERTKFTQVWVDGSLVGESFETLVPQLFELGKLTTGTHELTILVDNDLTAYDNFPESLYNGHQYTEHTQTNWNGILGEICIMAHAGVFVEKMMVQKKEDYQEITIETGVLENTSLKGITVEVVIRSLKTNNVIACLKKEIDLSKTTFSVPLSNFEMWDEFEQNLYEITASLYDADNLECCEKHSVITGIRDIRTNNRELIINSKRVSLRGSLDCAIYPLTGACPFEENEWEAILKKMKDYGMNHYRFHSWCPPEAAFMAADRLGVYLQVELSCFANEFYKEDDEKYDKVLEDYLYSQSKRVLEVFGNHPSFILFAVGNEMKGNLDAYNELLKELKKTRSDILYCQGSNNFLEDPLTCEEDQFWVTMRTERGKNIRASFSHNDLPLGTIQSSEIIGTLDNYDEAAGISQIPLISHEIGQFQSFPLLEDADKYTGPLRPDTYTILEAKLKEKGLLEKNREFYEASGALLVQCYKAEIEANLRTDNMSGFQLLGLQDFPGQGTALVGVLDSFLDSKGFIEAKDWRKFCNQVVVMATFSKYCYTAGEEIPMEIYIYNYSGKDLKGRLELSLQENETVMESITVDAVESAEQSLTKVYKGSLCTSKIKEPKEIKLKLIFENSYCENENKENKSSDNLKLENEKNIIQVNNNFENEYPLWIYPKEDESDVSDTSDTSLPGIMRDKSENDEMIGYFVGATSLDRVWVTNTHNEKVDEILKNNGKVLLCTSKRADAIEGFFPTDFWCYPMFAEACINAGNPVAPGTMGLLIDKDHPALEKFPTREYSQWQWQQIVTHSTSVILDDEKDLKMIVQVIDNFDRNHVLGLVFEKKMEHGKLLECSSDLLDNLDIPEIRQLFISLLNYIRTI